MPSLRQLRDRYASLLVIDAASTQIQVGWLTAAAPDRWKESNEEAGVGVFECIADLEVELGTVEAFIFCEGPGSILGIRTSAMALRIWNVISPRPCFAYLSLAILAEALGDPALTVIADARRELWHAFRIGEKLQRVPAAELPSSLATPDNFRSWSALPSGVTRVPYSLTDLLPKIPDAELFRATDDPDAFLHAEPSYATWTPQIHRAP